MWPPPDELIAQTLAAEAAVEDLYAEALRRWAPTAMAAILPTLDIAVVTAAGELPPDPGAVTAAQPHWDELVATVVLPGVAALWMAHAAAAAAADAVGATIGVGKRVLRSLLSTPRDQFLLSYGTRAALVPGIVGDKLRSMLNQATARATTQINNVADRPELRAMLRDAVTPGSEMMRATARQLGYQGSGILNDALMTVARFGDADRKQWHAILDERTRDTHWAADGQVALLDGTFTVGGVHMLFPGDPTAPPRETANCRCRLVVIAEGETAPGRRVPKTEAARRAERGVHRGADNPEEPIAASAAQEDTMTDIIDSVDTGLPNATQENLFRTFTDAVIAFIGTPTSDYRLLHKDIKLSFRSMPLPLMWCRQSKEGHADSFTVGVIESARQDADKILASGYMLNTPEADEAVEQLRHKVSRPSVDLSQVEWTLTDEAGDELSEADFFELPLNAKVFHTFNAAELIGTTLVSTPAFGDTELAVDEARQARDSSLVASAAAHVSPRVYPAGLFADPGLTEPTLPTMGEDGRVFGHIACWGQCHRSVQTSCVTAPRSPTNYSHFHTSPAVRLDDDTRLPVGRLTVGTGHAADNLAGVPAQAHYDNTGTCWALVRVGEDAHGIWFSGVSAPWATAEQIEAGLASPLSGDWRDYGQGLELVAALSVNTPGFAARGRDDDQGRPVALVAALGPGPQRDSTLTRDDIKAAVAQALSERDFVVARDAALARAELIAPTKSPRDQIAELLTAAGNVGQ